VRWLPSPARSCPHSPSSPPMPLCSVGSNRSARLKVRIIPVGTLSFRPGQIVDHNIPSLYVIQVQGRECAACLVLGQASVVVVPRGTNFLRKTHPIGTVW